MADRSEEVFQQKSMPGLSNCRRLSKQRCHSAKLAKPLSSGLPTATTSKVKIICRGISMIQTAMVWLYFEQLPVGKATPEFPQKLMSGLDWGIYYNKYGSVAYDPKALETRIVELIKDYQNNYITNQKVMSICLMGRKSI
ncbi:hypothetical protein [Hominenteromicrobium sp.]|uniref:hypothetical protein n=1 Tax=Hominenteromicrobium sp. TaxID=3073581 RepID=UPI003994A112